MEISTDFKEYFTRRNSKIELKLSPVLLAVQLKTLRTDDAFQSRALHHSTSAHRGTHWGQCRGCSVVLEDPDA